MRKNKGPVRLKIRGIVPDIFLNSQWTIDIIQNEDEF